MRDGKCCSRLSIAAGFGRRQEGSSTVANVAAVKPNPWIAFVILSSTVFMLLVDFSIVSVALPEIQKGLHATPAQAQWVISAYAVLFSGCLLMAGRCADVYGRRRLFFAGVTLFTVSSFVAGICADATLLVVMRAIQGLAAAIVNPSALALVISMFDDEKQRTRAIAYWGIVASIGVVAGMVLGGVLVALFGWRSAFFVNVPIGALVVIFGSRFIPRDAAAAIKRSVDPWAAVLMTAALLVLTFSIVRFPSEGWSHLTVGSAIAVVLLAVGYLLIERRTSDPLVPARLFRTQNFTASAVLGMVQAAGYGGAYVFVSEYFQQTAHFSPLATGIAFIPPTLVMACIAGPMSAPLAERFGPRAVSVVGSLFMIAGSTCMYIFSAPGGSPLLGVLPGLVVGSFGCMTTFEISMIAGLAHVPKDDDAIASATISTFSEMGISLGVAVGAALAIAAGSVHAAFVSAIIFSAFALLASAAIGRIPRIRHIHVRFGKMIHRQPATTLAVPEPQNIPA